MLVDAIRHFAARFFGTATRARDAIAAIERGKQLSADGAHDRAAAAFEDAIALDPRGATLSSEDLAARLGRLRDEGSAVAFAIGGADGLDKSVLRAARLSLSLGAMTWPHMLARVMLAEQIFRAQSILSGHPYHRG